MVVTVFILIDLYLTSALLGAALDNPLTPKALASNTGIIEYFILERKDHLYLTVQNKFLQFLH